MAVIVLVRPAVRRAARIVLKRVHLSTKDMASGLGWDSLKTRREKHTIKLVRNCIDGQAPSQVLFMRRLPF